MATEYTQARQIILDNTMRLKSEIIQIDQALNRVIAENVIAEMNIPPFKRSPLDGFALRAVDTVNASSYNPVKLRISGMSDCGQPFKGSLEIGQCLRILTGAPVPESVDAVIAQEEVKLENDTIIVFQPLNKEDNIVQPGEDIKSGELIIKNGTPLKPAHLGLLASLGRNYVKVYSQPVVAVFSTGQELAAPGSQLQEAEIYDYNTTLISTLVKEAQGIPLTSKPLADNVELLAASISEYLKQADALITSGGVSVGDHDLVAQAVKKAGGEILFWRLKMKPGTPMLAAKLNDKLIFCLSGNPGAAHVTFDLFVRPSLLQMSGNNSWRRPDLKAVLEHPLNKNNGQNRFIRAKCKYSLADGLYRVAAAEREKPGSISASIESNAIIYRPAGASELETGDSITIELTDLPEVKTSAGLLISTSSKKSEHKRIKRFFPKKVSQPVANSIR